MLRAIVIRACIRCNSSEVIRWHCPKRRVFSFLERVQLSNATQSRAKVDDDKIWTAVAAAYIGSPLTVCTYLYFRPAHHISACIPHIALHLTISVFCDVFSAPLKYVRYMRIFPIRRAISRRQLTASCFFEKTVWTYTFVNHSYISC